MTMNAKYLQEARELEKRWEGHPLLGAARGCTTVLLESQRLMNELPIDGDIAQFKRIQIPLRRREYTSPTHYWLERAEKKETSIWDDDVV